MYEVDYSRLGTVFPYEKAFRIVIRRAEERWRALVGCGRRELMILLCVTEGCNQKDVGVHLGLHPNVVVKILDGMEEADLLQRRRNRADRRSQALDITPKGQKTLETFQQHRPAVLQEIFAPLTLEEIEEWRAMSVKIVRGHFATGG